MTDDHRWGVVTLGELVEHPERVREMAPATAISWLTRLEALRASLVNRAMSGTATGAHPPQASKGVGGDPRLLTVPEVAKQLQITRAYAYQLARQGVLPAIRIGPKYVRVPEAALTKWIEKRQGDVPAEGGAARPKIEPKAPTSPGPARFFVFQGLQLGSIHNNTCGDSHRAGAAGLWHRGPGGAGFSIDQARATAKTLPVSFSEHTCITGRPSMSNSAARQALISMRETRLMPAFPNADPAHGLLRKGMIGALLRYRPTSMEEYTERIPQHLKAPTDPAQLCFLPEVFGILMRPPQP